MQNYSCVDIFIGEAGAGQKTASDAAVGVPS